MAGTQRTIILEIALKNGVIQPSDIQPILDKISQVLRPEEHGNAVVVISGRLPVWLYSAITHYLHPFRAVATFEPRLLRGVVVASHTPELRIGELVSVENAERVVVEYP